jgi:hypothetical protein
MRAPLLFVSLCALAAASLCCVACAAPLQNGSIAVQPGAEARLDLMCRYRADSSGAEPVCAATTEE